MNTSWERCVNKARTSNDRCIWKSSAFTAWGLSLTLGLGSAIVLSPGLNTPAAAQINNSRVSLFVFRAEGETYSTFLRRAEALARTGVQQTFDNDSLISEAVVTIIGENQGISVPIMEVTVTRNEWQERPDPQYWAVYYRTAPMLLNF
ncbi:MAG: hypothetical protein AAFN08_17935 [Cyanobacteria bacterium J06559_3]